MKRREKKEEKRKKSRSLSERARVSFSFVWQREKKVLFRSSLLHKKRGESPSSESTLPSGCCFPSLSIVRAPRERGHTFQLARVVHRNQKLKGQKEETKAPMGGVSGHGQKNKPHKSGRHAGRSAREKHAKSKGRFTIVDFYSLAQEETTRGGGARAEKRRRCRWHQFVFYVRPGPPTATAAGVQASAPPHPPFFLRFSSFNPLYSTPLNKTTTQRPAPRERPSRPLLGGRASSSASWRPRR